MSKEKKYNTKLSEEILLTEEPSVSYSLPNGFDLISLSRQGLTKGFLIDLAQKYALSLQELAQILHVSERTLQRYQNDSLVSSDISERALLLVQLFHKGLNVMGSSENFIDWLKTPLPAFQQLPPFSFLDTAFGFQLIFDELGRIEHGVFA